MAVRGVIIGAILVLVGAFTTVEPLQPTSTTTISLSPGNWTQVAVPPLASWTRGTVYLDLSLGCGPCCESSGYWPACLGYLPLPDLVLRDCGLSACVAGRDYSTVGRLSAGGSAAVIVAVGHCYQVEVYQSQAVPESEKSSVAVQYFLVGPILGGFGGVALAIGGVALVALSARSWAEERRYRPSDF